MNISQDEINAYYDSDSAIYNGIIRTASVPRGIDSKNWKYLRLWCEAIFKSYGVNTGLEFIKDVDRCNGVLLDYIGKYEAFVSRDIPESIDASGNMTDKEYRIILKLANSLKNTFPSPLKLQSTLSVFFGECYIKSENKTAIYIFNNPDIDKKIVTIVMYKKLLPQPIGVKIEVVINPDGKKFFNYPIGANGNIPIYRAYESGDDGSIIYDSTSNLLS